MKKLICLFLAMAAVCALAAGCTVEKPIGPTEPTTVAVNDADLNKAIDQLGELDDAALEALRRAMEQGIEIPPDIGVPPETAPPTMPAGVQASPNEVYPLMVKVYNTLGSGTFLLRAKGSSPQGGPTMGNATSMTLAMDGANTMMEFDMDWTAVFKAMSEGTPEYGQSIVQGITAQGLFGKKARFVSRPDDVFIAFPDKKTYLSMGAPEESGSEGQLGLAGAFSGTLIPDEVPDDIASSRVTMGGKEYLCATLNEGNARYYFLNGDLKRIEIENEGEVMILEIQELTGTVDPKLFTTEGMKVMPVDQMAQMGEGLGAIFGG